MAAAFPGLLFVVCFGAAAAVGDHPGPAFGTTGVGGVAFSADQRMLVTTIPTFTVWNVAHPAHPKRLAGFDDGQGCCGPPGFSPHGRILASGNNNNVILWNVADPARPIRIATLPAYRDLVRAVAFSPDGRTLATGYDDTLVLWNVTGPARPRRLQALVYEGDAAQYTGNAATVGMAVAFSLDGTILANASGHSQVSVWDVASPGQATHIATLTGHTDHIAALSFSRDGRLLATGSDDGIVILWNLTDPASPARGATLRIAAPPATTPVADSGSDTHMQLAFSPHGHTLTTIVANATATRWDATNPNAVTRITTLTRKDPGAGDVALSPDGRIVAGAAPDGSYMVRLWTLPRDTT